MESQFWKPAIKSLRPKYRAVGRQTLRNDHVRVFKTDMEVSLKEFKELDSHVSFTSDIWTRISQIHIWSSYITRERHMNPVFQTPLMIPHTVISQGLPSNNSILVSKRYHNCIKIPAFNYRNMYLGFQCLTSTPTSGFVWVWDRDITCTT